MHTRTNETPQDTSPGRPALSRRALVAATTVGLASPAGLLAGSGAAHAANPETGSLVLPAATDAITPFQLHVPQSAVDDLKRRLASARLPEAETVDDWSQGAPRARVGRLVRYWRDHYDWRRLERQLNGAGQFRTRIDGLGIHFLHIRSRHSEATPLILTHGWPGSVVEFLDAIGPLTDPVAHGGRDDEAFHVVLPSLPGFGLSDKPAETGWNPARIARAWAELMDRLGYRDYLAQGGDWGGGVTTQLGKLRPAGLAGVHLNFPEYLFAPPLEGDPTVAEQTALAQINKFFAYGAGYHREQSTRPQTIGYALADSPTGQAAWIYEKFGEWTDSDHNPEKLLGVDRILDAISLYWYTDTAASSARLYWEGFSPETPPVTELALPVGVSVFPKEIVRTPRIWAERAYSDLVYFNDEIGAGGHFAAFEQPRLFADEIRAFARTVRTSRDPRA